MAKSAVQAISGVTTGAENVVSTVYPSVCSHGLGRTLGRLYESIPFHIGGVKFSHLLFVLPTAPLGLVLYFLRKVIGVKYVITNRSVQCWSMIGSRMISQTSLDAIVDLATYQEPGQEFFKAGDIHLLGKGDETLMVLQGIVRPKGVVQLIKEVMQAGSATQQALEAINAR